MLEVLLIFADSPSIDTVPALQQIQNPVIFHQALELLADGARIEDRREAYGQLGLLDYLLELQHSCPHGRDGALRAIVNACADHGKQTIDRLLESCSSLVTRQIATENEYSNLLILAPSLNACILIVQDTSPSLLCTTSPWTMNLLRRLCEKRKFSLNSSNF